MTAALGLEYMLVTLSEKGIAILRPERTRACSSGGPAGVRRVGRG